MTNSEIKMVLDHVEAGGLVRIESCYLDSFATIYERDDGQIVYSSDVWAETPLATVPFGRLSFFREVRLEAAKAGGGG